MKLNKSDRQRYIQFISDKEGCGWLEAVVAWTKMSTREKRKIMNKEKTCQQK